MITSQKVPKVRTLNCDFGKVKFVNDDLLFLQTIVGRISTPEGRNVHPPWTLLVVDDDSRS